MAAVVGAVVGVLGLPLRVVVTHLYADVLPPALILACLLYLLATRRTHPDTGLPTLPTVVLRLLPAAVFLTLAAVVVLTTYYGRRTVLVLLLSGGVGTLILIQVLFAGREDLRPVAVLVQLLALAAVVRLAALTTTAGVIGVDTWTHVELARAVHDAGTLDAMLEFPSRAQKYYTAPLYHLLVVTTSILARVPIRVALYLSLGVAMVFVPLVIYATARLFIGPRWALAAAALYAISDQAVRWSLVLIPNSLSLVGFLVGLYLLVRIMMSRAPRDVVLLSVVVGATPLIHQVGAFVTFVVLASAVAVQLLLAADVPYRSDAMHDSTGILLFQAGIMTFVWSITPYRGGRFLGVVSAQFAGRLRESLGLFTLQERPTDAAAAEAAAGATGLIDTFVAYIDVFGFVFTACVGILGSLYVLNGARASQATLTFVLSSVAMGTFALVIPLFGIDMFLPGRWFAFLYAPMAVLGVLGLAYLATSAHPRVATACLLVVVIAFPATMLVAGDATRDAPPFSEHQLRFGYTESEVAGVHTVGTIVSADDPVWTDSPYATVFRRTDSHLAVQAAVTEEGRVADNRVVHRGYQTNGAPLFVRNGTVVVRRVGPRDACADRDVLYANGDVTLCVESRPPTSAVEGAARGVPTAPHRVAPRRLPGP